MSHIEDKIIGLLLTVLQKRRATRPEADTALDWRPGLERKVTRREVGLCDFEAVAAMKLRFGLGPDSQENWWRLWQNNPALVAGLAKPRMGWVLEAGDQIVGYLGSIPLLYHYGNKILVVAATSCLMVESAYRAFTLSLVGAFFHQENTDLFLNTTATPVAGKISGAFKARPLPQEDYDSVLFWVLDPHNLAKAVVRQLGITPELDKLGAILGSVVLRGDVALRRRWPRGIANNFHIDEIGVSDIGDEFQGLWLRKLNEKPRLLADRTPGILRWHFEIPGNRRTTRVLRCYSAGRLVGYAIVTNEFNREVDLHRSIIADLLVEDEDPHIVERLLIAAYEHARNAGSHVLEVLGFPRSIREICFRWRPYSRKYPACPFFYKADNPALRERLAKEDAWYACPFDGDTTITP